MRYARSFNIDLREMETIEEALNHRLSACLGDLNSGSKRVNSTTLKTEICEIRNLLGSLHNQKDWFRPKDTMYISG